MCTPPVDIVHNGREELDQRLRRFEFGFVVPDVGEHSRQRLEADLGDRPVLSGQFEPERTTTVECSIEICVTPHDQTVNAADGHTLNGCAPAGFSNWNLTGIIDLLGAFLRSMAIGPT